MSGDQIVACPTCGVRRSARRDALCRDCDVAGRQGRAQNGYGPAPLDEFTMREVRAALDELHRNYGYPDAA